jgi:RNA polymerase sigma-70 factor (ECF subfamily)
MMAEGIEEEVRRLVREDDPRALEVLYDAVGAGLYAFLAARLRDPHEAEDVLQQVFLDLARRPGRLLGARRMGPWLFAKARNLAIDRLRARRRLEKREAEWPAWLEPAGPGGGLAGEGTARLAALVDGLPAEQREVIALKVFQEKTFAEVGEVLGISINTAASRYRYALEKLRQGMLEKGCDGS